MSLDRPEGEMSIRSRLSEVLGLEVPACSIAASSLALRAERLLDREDLVQPLTLHTPDARGNVHTQHVDSVQVSPALQTPAGREVAFHLVRPDPESHIQ